MPRPSTGQVLERKGRNGEVVWAIRFRAIVERDGKRVRERFYETLDPQPANEEEARQRLRHRLADVERGLWRPSATEPVAVDVGEEPTFHVYASEWVERRRHEVDDRTVEHWRWALTCHLLGFFRDYRPSQITGRLVDQYKTAKLRERGEIEKAHAKKERLDERGLSAGSINKTLKVLAQILDDAVEDGYATENVARGKRRRLKAAKPKRTWLELGEVKALIDAAGDHRALIATLVLAGLRISELIALRWRDVDLANGRLEVADSKTDAGRRVVDLSPWLREELITHKATSTFVGPDDFVFATRNGTCRQRSNISRQILAPAIEAANAKLAKAGKPPIKSDVTNHSLRRTFASLLYEAGASPAYVMAQMGHESSALALEMYAKVMERKRETGARMDELVRGADWAQTGTNGAEAVEPVAAAANKNPA